MPLLDHDEALSLKTWTDPYRYKPLKHGTIRLLRTQDRLLGEGCLYTLDTFDISKAPAFHALSYTWGKATVEEPDDKTFTCLKFKHGGHLRVRSNLAHFLQAWPRATSFSRIWIWIDAICINQSDADERQQQVGMMGDIYGRCQATLIWLGKSTAGFDSLAWIHGPFLDSLEQYVEKNGYEGLENTSVLGLNIPKLLGLDIMEDRWLEVLKDYASFGIRRNWFERIWVLQELVLARECIIFGPTAAHVTWWSMLRLSRIMVELNWSSYLGTLLNSPDVGRPTLPKHISRYDEMQQVQNLHLREFKTPTDRNAALDDGLKDILGGHQPSITPMKLLYALTLWTNRLQASDPRDKIYALLGLVKNHRCWLGLEGSYVPLPEPSYLKSTEELYTETTVGFLKDMGTFLPLVMATNRHVAQTFSSLPSWVLDFTTVSNAGILHYGTRQAWPRRSGETSSFSVDGRELVVQGVAVDGINLQAQLLDNGLKPPSLADLLFLFSTLDPAYLMTGETRAEALARTLVTNLSLGPSTESEVYIACVSYVILTLMVDDPNWVYHYPQVPKEAQLAIHELLTPTGEPEATLSKVLSALLDQRERLGRGEHADAVDIGGRYRNLYPEARYLYGVLYERFAARRNLFRTHGGFIGLGPDWMQNDDVVVLFEHGAVPFILRQEEGSDRYRFIGDAYVHGFEMGAGMTERALRLKKTFRIV